MTLLFIVSRNCNVCFLLIKIIIIIIIIIIMNYALKHFDRVNTYNFIEIFVYDKIHIPILDDIRFLYFLDVRDLYNTILFYIYACVAMLRGISNITETKTFVWL